MWSVLCSIFSPVCRRRMEFTAVLSQLTGMALAHEQDYDLYMMGLDVLFLVPMLLLGKYLFRNRYSDRLFSEESKACKILDEDQEEGALKKPFNDASEENELKDDDDASTDEGEAGTDEASSVADESDTAAEEDLSDPANSADESLTPRSGPYRARRSNGEAFPALLKGKKTMEAKEVKKVGDFLVHDDQQHQEEGKTEKVKINWEKPRVRLEKRLHVLSGLMAKTLRHTAQELGLKVAADGFAEVSALLELPPFRGYALEDIEAVVAFEAEHGKGRFSLKKEEGDDEGVVAKVRANQGHSINGLEDEALLHTVTSEEELPKTLIHGTSFQAWEQIHEAGGLKSMSRKHIHLAAPGSGGVGGLLRKSVEVKLFVDTRRALARGVTFFKSENGVLLSPGLPESDRQPGLLPLDCCSKVVLLKTGEPLWSPPSCALLGLQDTCRRDDEQSEGTRAKPKRKSAQSRSAPRASASKSQADRAANWRRPAPAAA